MTSGIFPLLPVSLALLLLTSHPARSQEIDDLERDLARAPPVSESFVEYRFSHVLKRPTRITGVLEYRADGVMIRNVASPRPERSEVSGDEVRIHRGDKPARRISLQRAPQLRILLSSFRALLEGRITPLAQDFVISLTGEHGSWKLGLRPLDARVAAYLARIEVYGHGPRLHCMEAIEPDGDATLTLFGSPEIPALRESRIDLEQFCRAGARAPAHATP